MIASIVTLLIPLWILLGVVALMGVLILLGRVHGGRYLRPVINFIAKVPLFKRWLQKASTAALERSNPELASAMRKMQRSRRAARPEPRAGGDVDAHAAGAAGAHRDAGGTGHGAGGDEPPDAARRMEKARRDAQRRGR